MSIYVNRILNMKHIKAIGLDMDHTLVRYNSDEFEKLTFNITREKLIADYGYPKNILDFKFDFSKAIRGLIVDTEKGNFLKVSLYNKIKTAFHGTKRLGHKQQKAIYRTSNVDLREEHLTSVDTTFSVAFVLLFGQLVDLKDECPELQLPSYAEIARQTLEAVDIAHRDGSLKNVVKKNLSDFLICDEKIVQVLERFKKYGKKIWIITNSDYDYTKSLLDFTITPFLKEHKCWQELFEVTVTLASKPHFFTDRARFLKVLPESGHLVNHEGPVLEGIFQGGNGVQLQKDHHLSGDEILYLGDHIYGDILKLKKTCEWRTALVLEEIDNEVRAYKNTKSISIAIDELMQEKISVEKAIDDLYSEEFEHKRKVDKKRINEYFSKIEDIDNRLAQQIKKYEGHFNSDWGEVMRAGAEASFYASQIDRYACIYMSKISDFFDYNPRHYFRPKKKKLSHEL